MKTNYLFAFALLCTPLWAQQTNTPSLSFTQLYETACTPSQYGNDGDKSFLKFYPDGKVIVAATDCDVTAADLKEWFHLGAEYISTGDYKIKGNHIRFATKSITGIVQYKGTLTQNHVLKLRSKSLINGHRQQEVFFIKSPSAFSHTPKN